jgi:succinate dehydrogenase / fumarate reductase cytochrome b subunit
LLGLLAPFAGHTNVGIALVHGICLKSAFAIWIENMAEAKSTVARPLSPHLTIYRPMLSMMMSIVHRMTGVALYIGSLLLAWWLLAVAAGPNAYATFQSVASSFIGRVVLFGYTWALMHHMLGGLRHLIWDTARPRCRRTGVAGACQSGWLNRADDHFVDRRRLSDGGTAVMRTAP